MDSVMAALASLPSDLLQKKERHIGSEGSTSLRTRKYITKTQKFNQVDAVDRRAITLVREFKPQTMLRTSEGSCESQDLMPTY